MPLPFLDRHDAGRQLASRLSAYAGQQDVLVLGLPRGGVPVASEVAHALGAPLDVFVVRKLGVPGHSELAMGAIASGGVRVLSQELLRALRIPSEAVEKVTSAEQRELVRRERDYRLNRPFPDLSGKTVILVDDGVATGSTMLAAVQALRQQRAGAIVVAAPVMSEDAALALARAADRCEAVAIPTPFYAVGAWYHNFAQTSDEEVRRALREAAARKVPGDPVKSEARYAGRT